MVVALLQLVFRRVWRFPDRRTRHGTPLGQGGMEPERAHGLVSIDRHQHSHHHRRRGQRCYRKFSCGLKVDSIDFHFDLFRFSQTKVQGIIE